MSDPDPKTAECSSYRNAVINGRTWEWSVASKWTGNMNWNKAGRALKAPCVPWRWRKQSRNVAEQQARLKEVGIAELGGRRCTSELQPSVMKLGDVWIKLVMLLCERENSAERHSWVSCGWIQAEDTGRAWLGQLNRGRAWGAPFALSKGLSIEGEVI